MMFLVLYYNPRKKFVFKENDGIPMSRMKMKKYL